MSGTGIELHSTVCGIKKVFKSLNSKLVNPAETLKTPHQTELFIRDILSKLLPTNSGLFMESLHCADL